jgi:fatty acid desaturase
MFTRNFVGYSHFLIYLFTHFLSLYAIIVWKLNFMLFFYSWSIFGISSIGHDAIHGGFTKNKKLDPLIGKLTLNMFLVTDDRWLHIHNKIHHQHVNEDIDVMRLKGNTFFEELYNVYYSSMFSGYNSFNLINIILKIPFGVCLYFMPWYSLFIVLFFFSLFGAYLTYITHSFTIKILDPSINDLSFINKQLINSFDVSPQSYFLSLICGGLNAHASHHVYPNITRTELLKVYDKLKTHPYYRCYTCLDVVKMYLGY